MIASDRLPDRAVASRAARELTEVQAMAAGDGWTEIAVARALAAVRLIAALAIRHPISEKVMKAGAPVPDGRLEVAHGRMRTMRAAVSSAVTATDVAMTGSQLADSASLTRRQQLEGLQAALADLTAALYRQAPVRDAATLNEAARHGVSAARELERERNWWRSWWSQR